MRISFGLFPLQMSVNKRQIKKETVVPTGIANGLPLTCNHAFSVVYQRRTGWEAVPMRENYRGTME
jgi:hypothetical protein